MTAAYDDPWTVRSAPLPAGLYGQDYPQPTDDELDPDAPAGFPWDATPVLTQVRQAAQSRLASPFAVLGCVLARVVADIGPGLQLPPIVGGRASLNLFVALSGRTSAGKGSASGAARDLLASSTAGGRPAMQIGTGEGFVHAFMRRTKGTKETPGGPELYEARRFFEVAEVDALAAKGAGRQGSTILSTLRQAWSGEDVGSTTADPDRNLTVQAHTYRACLILGVQPGRASWLFDGEAVGGTTGRLLWVPTNDPHAPDDTPDWPGRLPWRAPTGIVDRGPVGLPPAVVQHVRTERLARLRGQVDVDPLDGHRTLVALKTAAAFAILHGRRDVTPDDWHLALALLDVSDTVRGEITSDLAAQAAAQSEQRGRAEGRRRLASDEVVHTELMRKTSASVIRILQRNDGTAGQATVLKALSTAQRDYLPEVLEALSTAGRLDITEGAREGYVVLRLREADQ